MCRITSYNVCYTKLLRIIIAAALIVSAFTLGGEAAAAEKFMFIQSPFAFVVLAAALLAGVFIYGVVQGKVGKIAADNAKNGVGANRIFNYLFFWISYNYENGKDIRLYNAQDMLGEQIV